MRRSRGLGGRIVLAAVAAAALLAAAGIAACGTVAARAQHHRASTPSATAPAPEPNARLACVRRLQVVLGALDGSGARQLGAASSVTAPLLAPDGQLVATPQLGAAGGVQIDSVAGRPRTVPGLRGELNVLAWSPDSRYFAAELALTPGFDIVDARTDRITFHVTGIVGNVSFAPSGPDRIAYSRERAHSSADDLWTASATGSGTPQRVASGQGTLSAVWARQGILYTDTARPHQIFQLGDRALPAALSDGLPVLIGASADGQRLLLATERSASDPTGPYETVDLTSGQVHVLPVSLDVTEISRDGMELLAEDHAGDTVELSSTGGAPRTLARDCAGPSWNL